MSKKREAQNRKYLKIRRKFLEDKFCEVTGKPAQEVHHIKGRIGDLLLDQKFWMAVSREGHNWIHNNVNLAREKGWIK